MSQQPLDVLAIGNAIVDVIASASPALLAELGLEEDSMRLVDEDESAALYAKMGPGREISGGSASNSIAGIAMLGGKAALVGKVKADQLGGVFTHDIRSVGVEFFTSPASSGPATASCLILVPPSGRRVMNTFLGAANTLSPEDLDARQIGRAQITLVEGYAWTADSIRATAKAAIATAHRHARKVAFTLAADWLAGNPVFGLKQFIPAHVDILFANEAEIKALTGAATFDDALQWTKGAVEIACLTRSEKGSVIVAGDEVHVIDPAPVTKVVDTTGAGDLYAGGFLYGLTQGRPLAECGRIGAICAAEIISHFGARPEQDLQALVKANGL
jgi:sugar/nucleoside kinase (ribokinase family)